MSSVPSVPDHEEMQRFSATGRPYKAPTKADKMQGSLSSIGVSDTFYGNAAPNLLPVRFTDDSLIPVPVLRPEDVAAARQRRLDAASSETGANNDDSKKADSKKKFWKSRRASKDGGLNENFIIKKIPRGIYLKHYAKDEQGKYCGTEDPAEDCLLRGEDLTKYRNRASGAQIAFDDNISMAETLVDRNDGIIR